MGMEIRRVKIVLKYLFNSITFSLSLLISKQQKISFIVWKCSTCLVHRYCCICMLSRSLRWKSTKVIYKKINIVTPERTEPIIMIHQEQLSGSPFRRGGDGRRSLLEGVEHIMWWRTRPFLRLHRAYYRMFRERTRGGQSGGFSWCG